MTKTSWKRVTEGLFGGPASAVTITPRGTYLLEADGNGIYRKESSSPWTLVKRTSNRHRHIYSDPHSQLILTCGDKGSVLASFDDGISWVQRNQGIPSSTLWTIVALNENEWLTHSSHYIYFSANQGVNWVRMDPFLDIEGRKPEIRTLCVAPDGTWLLGTKVHPTLGGLWAFHENKWLRVKEERFSMIASIHIYGDHLLIATGACRKGGRYFGAIKALHYTKRPMTKWQDADWFTIDNDQPQRGYLDIHSTNNHIVVAAYGDGSTQARGGVFKINWEEKKMVPVGKQKGHVWRVAVHHNDWISAGVNSVEYSNPSKDWFQGFQNFNVTDLIEFKEQIWIATTNDGILSSLDEKTWSNRNHGLPQGVKFYQFQQREEELYLETSCGIYVKKDQGWVPCIPEINDDSKILTYQGKSTIVNPKGIWQKGNARWVKLENLLTNPFEGHQLFDAVSIGKLMVLATNKGLFQYDGNGFKMLHQKQDIVQLYWLHDTLFGITKNSRLQVYQPSGWEHAFPYPFKVYNILPSLQDQILICTNKGLFTASLKQSKRIQSIFVCPNVSNLISYKNKWYVGSYTNGLWAKSNP